MADFLGINLPKDLKSDLQRAKPLLYKCVQRLGSFPYLHQPAPVLTDNILRVSLSILLQRHEQLSQPVGVKGGAVGSMENQAYGMRSLLFQSMRDSQAPLNSLINEKDTPRTDEKDDYLLQAHRIVSKLNSRRPPSNPTRIEFGPPIIAAEALPSSNSDDYSGTIPQDQLTSFLRICKHLGSGSTLSDITLNQVDTADFAASPVVGWEAFDDTLSSSQVSTNA